MRTNALEYTERRLIIPDDVEIPGETGPSRTQPPDTWRPRVTMDTPE
ncbi:hypothetical protein OB919_20130 [Halobacteria archaeon AArc-curdl1]|uniref:Uncharacterized protein n=1 Tax=Natronosalvus hydrolyticus TaxID=2979988 RepID=A0AAP2ZBL6_9EURY|nr:hypothetical protein [Natronosalvus amylolyticus]MCU4754259.1 hypothetical protein [Halobacteria archaeon AArc-curdl1]